jgi:hypothetical protein
VEILTLTGQNIFSALAKYNSAIDENYLTESFIFVVNSLLSETQTSDRGIGCEFLTWICAKNNEFNFASNDIISVSTQERTGQGTPDIMVTSPNKLIYIEVKHDSPLGDEQISRYKKALDESQASIKKVVLLTRFPIDFKDKKEEPYKHVHWYEVYNWFSVNIRYIKDPVNTYLTKSFNAFLEEKKMSLQKVGWEYINGMPQMLNMMSMIEAAIEGAGIKLYPSYPRAVALEWRGFYLGSNSLLCGIYYSDPLRIFLELEDKKNWDKNLLPTPTYPIHENSKVYRFYLALEDYHFFSLNKDEQLALITKFVKTAYEEANKMKKP